MQVKSAICLRLLHLDRNAVSISPRILANAGHLPGDFNIGLIGFDGELVICHLAGHNSLRELAHHRELIAEITVQSLKPFGQGNHCAARRVGSSIAVVDVHHVGRFDEGVIEVLVGGIQRMIDLEGTTSLGEVAIDVDIAIEKRRVAAVLLVGKQSVASGGVVESAADAVGARSLTVHAETR